MLQSILWAGAILGGLGLLFGLFLGVANRFFGVKTDGRVLKIREELPGANCGGCGFPGCDAFAAAVVKGEAPVNGCPVSSPDVVGRIAKIMGVDAGDVRPLLTVVSCRGTASNTGEKYTYEGLEDCAAAAQLDEGYKNCRFSCLGLGNCTRVCPTGAVTIQNGLAVIDHELCINCGKCVAACPRGIIRMVPADSKIRLLCRAQTKGKEVREACQVGCIGCGLCARTCKFGALTMVNDLPVCDFDKCVGCMECARKCPRQCLWADFEHTRVAFINPDKCTGCDDCAQACKFSAIEGEPMAPHAVLRDKCVGCGECDRACQPDAVVMTRQK